MEQVFSLQPEWEIRNFWRCLFVGLKWIFRQNSWVSCNGQEKQLCNVWLQVNISFSFLIMLYLRFSKIFWSFFYFLRNEWLSIWHEFSLKGISKQTLNTFCFDCHVSTSPRVLNKVDEIILLKCFWKLQFHMIFFFVIASFDLCWLINKTIRYFTWSIVLLRL